MFLKAAAQGDMIKKASHILTFISHGIEFKNMEVTVQLCEIIVRPLLNNCVEFCSTYYKNEIIAFVRIQRFARRMPRMESSSFLRGRLDMLGSFPWNKGN